MLMRVLILEIQKNASIGKHLKRLNNFNMNTNWIRQ